MSAIVDPRPGRSHPFAGRDCRCVAHRRYQIPVAACLDAQNAEPVLGVMECHALDEPGEYLASLIPMLLTHVIISIRSCSRPYRCGYGHSLPYPSCIFARRTRPLRLRYLAACPMRYSALFYLVIASHQILNRNRHASALRLRCDHRSPPRDEHRPHTSP